KTHKERLHYAHTLQDDKMIQAERLKVRGYQTKIRNLINQHDFLTRDYRREKLYIS
ncbi:capsid protein, partial [Streptococcus pneumoniae]|nr:capsid protein [Streptococcus pneumoniae]